MNVWKWKKYLKIRHPTKCAAHTRGNVLATLRVSSFPDLANVGTLGSCDRVQVGSSSLSPSSSRFTDVAVIPRTYFPWYITSDTPIAFAMWPKISSMVLYQMNLVALAPVLLAFWSYSTAIEASYTYLKPTSPSDLILKEIVQQKAYES